MRGHFHSSLSKVNFKSKYSSKLKIKCVIDFELVIGFLDNVSLWFDFVSDDNLKLSANLITFEFDF